MLQRLLSCAAIFSTAATLQAQSFSSLYSFDNTPHGAQAEGSLVVASNTIYGTTLEGGFGSGGGTVYSMNIDGSGYSVLQSFNYNGDTNGFGPSSGLVLSGDMLYGTCSEGGSSNYGTIFGLQTNGNNFFILHEFTGTVDQGAPMGGMTLLGDTLFGTTQYGTIFSVRTNGAGFTNLHTFSGPDGTFPTGTLTISDGIIYGTTSSGGSNDAGTVFAIRPDGTGFTNLHYFVAATDGSSPGAGVSVAGGMIYGTATYGGTHSDGSVFSISTNGEGFAVLHFFSGTNSDGSHPAGDLTVAGATLYGTTLNGGTNNMGAIFSMNIDGAFYADLFDFSAASGAYPSAGVTLANQILYGTTTEDSTNNWGDIYAFHLPLFQALEITTQPVGRTNVEFGGSVLLTVVAQSSITPVLEYQWRLNGVNIPGGTNSVLSIAHVEATNCGVYTVVVSDGESSLTSVSAAVTPDATVVAGGDAITNAAALSSHLTGIIASANAKATAQAGETPILPGNPPAKSIWFKWTAPSNGVATFTTQGSGFDTVLGAFAASTQNRVGLGDDDGGGYLTSLITFNVKQNTSYLIGVDGHGGASGNILLSWRDDPGPPGPVITAPPVEKTVVSNSATALFSCEANGADDTLWFKDGETSSLAGGTDFGIGSVGDSTVGTYFAVVSSSFGSVQTEPFQLQINVLEDGTTDTNSLAYNKFLDAAANSFAQPPPVNQHVRTGGGDVRGYTTSQTFSTVGNVCEPDEPSICGQIGGAPAWYAYVAPTNGAMAVNTTGSDFNTMLAVYDGSSASFASLNNLSCGYEANAGQGQPQLYVPRAAKNQTFFIQVDGFHGASGVVQLNIIFGQPVAILTPPQDQYVTLGASASFTVIVKGSTPLSYQWQVNGTNIPLATNAVLNFPSVQQSQLGIYTVLVTNSVSEGSYSAQLGLSAAPAITTQAQSGVVHSGATATLNVIATGAPPPVFYWSLNGASVGGPSNSLVIPNFQTANEGTYSVLASNSFGVAAGSNALLYLDTFRLLAPTLSAGSFQGRMTAPAGSNYLIQTSTDLSNWTPLSTGYAADGILDFHDTNVGDHTFRFYRAVTN